MNEMILYVALIVGMFFLAWRRMKQKSKVYRRMPDRDFPRQWKSILQQRVPFYKRLSGTDKEKFEKEVHIFLLNYQIEGNGTEVTDLDRILIAAGAIIPIFRLEKWHYLKLERVVVFPDKFRIPETDKMARGLVGWGEMEGQMWLSRKAIYQGFHDDNDQKNVVIHEFIHMMDMQDGFVDGVLEELMAEEDIIPWLELIKEKSSQIGQERNAIRDYAKANPVEFLAGTSEFYFENPNKLQSEHPAIYRALDKIYNPKVNWF